MKKITTQLLFVLLSVFFLEVTAQSPVLNQKQDSLLAPVVLLNGKAQINDLRLFPDSRAPENLLLELSVAPQPQSKIFAQSPIRIEVVRLNSGKIEYIEIARFFLPWTSAKNNEEAVFVFDISAYSSLFQQGVILQAESNNPALSVALNMRFQWKSGQSPAKVKRIINLWHSDIKGFPYADKTKPINQQIKNKSFRISKDIKYALLKIYLSGNGRENQIPSEEECSKFYFLNINGQSVAKRPIWRDDCGLNALFPQEGPWMYSRPNWCPGQALRVYDHLIPLGADTIISINLQLQEASKENPMLQNYILTGNLILFGEAQFKNDAGLVEILAPNKNLANNRYNPICGSPVIRVRNTGSDTLKSVLIQYGLDTKTDNRYRWSGELAFMEEEIVYLPPPNWYFYDQKTEPSEFSVTIQEVNNMKDEYKGNNQLSTDLHLAPVYPNRINIQFSASQATENILELVDDMGVPLFEAAEFINDSVYDYELNLLPGCYEFIVYDLEGNGINSSKGKNGKLKILDAKTKQELKVFEPNFGAEIRQQFMILK